MHVGLQPGPEGESPLDLRNCRVCHSTLAAPRILCACGEPATDWPYCAWCRKAKLAAAAEEVLRKRRPGKADEDDDFSDLKAQGGGVLLEQHRYTSRILKEQQRKRKK